MEHFLSQVSRQNPRTEFERQNFPVYFLGVSLVILHLACSASADVGSSSFRFSDQQRSYMIPKWLLNELLASLLPKAKITKKKKRYFTRREIYISHFKEVVPSVLYALPLRILNPNFSFEVPFFVSLHTFMSKESEKLQYFFWRQKMYKMYSNWWISPFYIHIYVYIYLYEGKVSFSSLRTSDVLRIKPCKHTA